MIDALNGACFSFGVTGIVGSCIVDSELHDYMIEAFLVLAFLGSLTELNLALMMG
jgi:hypothetical protein